MRRLGTLAIVLSACGGGGGDTVIKTQFDPCAPLALVSSDASAEELAAMQDAEALWRDRGAPAFGLRSDTDNTLQVKFSDAAWAFHGLYDDNAGIVYINKKLVDPELPIVIAHEVGHAFGLFHVPADERVSVMNPGNLSTPPTEEDQAAVAKLWGTCN